MFVKHLQQYLDRFTEGPKGSKGNAVSNARIYVHVNGHLEEIKRIEVQESNIIGDSSIRVVLKPQRERLIIAPNNPELNAIVTSKMYPVREADLYQKVRKKTPDIIWNKIENISVPGMPDALAYNKNHYFFTVEFKATKGYKLRFRPHQIAWHLQHPKHTFILAKSHGQRSVKLFQGSQIRELVACGLTLDACASGLDACCLFLSELGA